MFRTVAIALKGNRLALPYSVPPNDNANIWRVPTLWAATHTSEAVRG